MVVIARNHKRELLGCSQGMTHSHWAVRRGLVLLTMLLTTVTEMQGESGTLKAFVLMLRSENGVLRYLSLLPHSIWLK